MHNLYTETWEDLPITFSQKDIDRVYAIHYDLITIISHIYGLIIQRLMENEGSN